MTRIGGARWLGPEVGQADVTAACVTVNEATHMGASCPAAAPGEGQGARRIRVGRHEEGSTAGPGGREERADPVCLRFTPHRTTGWATVAWLLVVLRRVDDCQGTLPATAEPRCFRTIV